MVLRARGSSASSTMRRCTGTGPVLGSVRSRRQAHHHRDDLRFYALLQTLRQRVPPRKLVTYYLDYAEGEAEDVTEGILQAALARALDGVRRHIELTVDGREPVKRPGVACRWCPVRADCAQGAAFLHDDQDGA